MSLPKATGQCDPEVMGCHLCHIAEHTAEDVLMIIKNLGGVYGAPLLQPLPILQMPWERIPSVFEPQFLYLRAGVSRSVVAVARLYM